jgi:dipeptidase D
MTNKVLRLFEEISAVPRQSGQEKQIISWLEAFADSENWKHKRDKAGNLCIYVPGDNSNTTVALQTHCDMVCVAKPGYKHDFSRDPIIVEQHRGWIKAHKTSLGADNGIGMAIALQMGKETFKGKPNLELLFTVGEETGMTGAFGIDKDMLSASCMINLDSDSEGFLVGCAGGQRATITAPVEYESAGDKKALKLRVKGLRGGHSGVDMDSTRLNAITILGELLFNACTEDDSYGISLVEFSGGTADNIIASHGEMVIAADKYDDVVSFLVNERCCLEDSYEQVEEKMFIAIEKYRTPLDKVVSPAQTKSIGNLLKRLPYGVVSKHKEFDVVGTSCNFGKVLLDDKCFKLSMSLRSNEEENLDLLSNKVSSVASNNGFKCEFSARYPGFEANTDSNLVRVAKKAVEKVSGEKPELRVVHAGLECGVIQKKYPNMETISLGVTIEDPHSISERAEVKSIVKCFNTVQAILKDL